MTEPVDENEKPVETVEAVKPAKIVKTKPRVNWVVLGVLVLIVAASVAGVMWLRQGKSEPAASAETAPSLAKGALKAYATGSMAKIETHDAPKTLEDISFFDRDGKSVKLSEFKGRVVVLNVWATWCAPCRVEMPTLANLQKQYDPEKVLVLALSIDEASKLDEVKNFMDVHDPLVVYNDPEVQALSKWGVIGMPTTIVLDKQGLEVARLSGEAHWDTPEAKALIDAVAGQ